MTSLMGSTTPGRRPAWRRFGRVPTFALALICLGFFAGGVWLTIHDKAMAAPADSSAKAETAKGAVTGEAFKWCEPIFDNTGKYSDMERYSLYAVLAVALAGLAYAGMLVGQVTKADRGTPRMQEIAAAVREGANAYLKAQFSKIVPLILLITVLLYATKYAEWEFAIGRSGAFWWVRSSARWSVCAA